MQKTRRSLRAALALQQDIQTYDDSLKALENRNKDSAKLESRRPPTSNLPKDGATHDEEGTPCIELGVACNTRIARTVWYLDQWLFPQHFHDHLFPCHLTSPHLTSLSGPPHYCSQPVPPFGSSAFLRLTASLPRPNHARH